jgi:hypothetical protein
MKMDERVKETCQHERWYKLPSGKRGHVRECKNPAKERSHIIGTGDLGLYFNMIEVLCDEHAA